MHANTHTYNFMTILWLFSRQTTQPFYGSLDIIWDNPGEPAPEGTFRYLLDFLEQNEDNTGRHINNPDGLPPIQTNWCPYLCNPHHFYAGCPCLHNPPNLSWLGTGTNYAGLHTRWLGYTWWQTTTSLIVACSIFINSVTILLICSIFRVFFELCIISLFLTWTITMHLTVQFVLVWFSYVFHMFLICFTFLLYECVLVTFFIKGHLTWLDLKLGG